MAGCSVLGDDDLAVGIACSAASVAVTGCKSCGDPPYAAAVDLSQGQKSRSMAEPPVPGDHDLAATLKALAANSSSFGGDPNAQGGALDPDALNSDMLNK